MSAAPTIACVRRWLLRALFAVLPVALAACGGGDQYASGGIVGTGDAAIVSVGTISAVGAGNVTVNGMRFATTGATVSVNGQPSTESVLKVGMVVTVQGRALSDGTAAATSIEYRAEVQGVVGGVDGAALAFTVLGQRVRTDRATVFDGGTFDTLLNQYVEVSGFRSSPGDLLATRVEIRSSIAAGALLEVTGVVSAFDPVGKTFRIGAQLVDFTQVPSAFVPPGLANGAVIDVHGTMVAAGDRLIANDLQLIPTTVPGPEASRVEIEGLVTDYAGIANFRVNGQVVDGSAATVTSGAVAMLGNGVKVEVEGRLAQGVVIASAIEIEQDVVIVLDGTVDAVDVAGGSVTVAGERVTVSGTTQFEDKSAAGERDFSLAAIHVGDRLSIRAARSATGLVAARIERLDLSAPPISEPSAKAEGAITEFVSVANFKVGGRKVNASSAKFEQGVAADLADGRRVGIEGTLAGDVLMATKVEFKPTDTTTPTSVSIEGAITEFVSSANFKVALQQVDATGAMFEGGTAADLANGRRVGVEGTVSGGVLAARKVSIKAAPTAATLEVEGTITDFVSPASFKVAGQWVDASKATVRNGTVADLANGRKVEANGTVVSGVLQATAVELKDATELEGASASGKITEFVSAANFKVAGRVIDATAAVFEHGTAADLANGRQVEVAGKLVGGVLRAMKVEFE